MIPRRDREGDAIIGRWRPGSLRTGRPRPSLLDRIRLYLWGSVEPIRATCPCCASAEPLLRLRLPELGDPVHVQPDPSAPCRPGILSAADGAPVVLEAIIGPGAAAPTWQVVRDLPPGAVHSIEACPNPLGVAPATLPRSPELAATVRALREVRAKPEPPPPTLTERLRGIGRPTGPTH